MFEIAIPIAMNAVPSLESDHRAVRDSCDNRLELDRIDHATRTAAQDQRARRNIREPFPPHRIRLPELTERRRCHRPIECEHGSRMPDNARGCVPQLRQCRESSGQRRRLIAGPQRQRAFFDHQAANQIRALLRDRGSSIAAERVPDDVEP